jgi:hypothetical protein
LNAAFENVAIDNEDRHHRQYDPNVVQHKSKNVAIANSRNPNIKSACKLVLTNRGGGGGGEEVLFFTNTSHRYKRNAALQSME